MKTFYLTTPIYYANSLPHLGHLYTTIVADAVNRYKKQRGFETYFLTGTDEHGINIERKAAENNRTPQEQVDFIAGELKKTFADFGLSPETGGYDVFMRTTEPFHYEGAQTLWRTIAQNKTPRGNETIYKGFYEGWFCAACASFKTEDEYQKSDAEGEPPLCLIHERPLDRVEEESYFFRLSDYGEILLDTIANNPNLIRPEARRNEIVAFIGRGLQDLSISRLKTSVSWGIPVPGDDNHRMYVWLDALSNYITAIGYGNTERAAIGFEKFWANAHHFTGKDILRHHTVYWFSFLLAAGLPLPQMVFSHGLWLDPNGRKMSKTLGNVIDLNVLHNYFANDAVRYFCLREMAFGQDGRFGYENLIDRTNADLASGLGNLSSRTLTMIGRYCNGEIPHAEISDANYLTAKRVGVQPDPQELASVVELARNEFLQQFDDFEFHRALETAWNIIARVDKMISEAKPWELIKYENQREILSAVLYRATETLRWLCVLLHPTMPDATRKIYAQLGLSGDLARINPAELTWGELAEGTKIGAVEALFPRLDKKKIMSEIENSEQKTVISEQLSVNSEQAAKADEIVPAMLNATKDEGQMTNDEGRFITIDDFLKVELRVGEILSAERLLKSDKLLIFKIDLGETEPRQVLAGLAEYYEPEKLIGRKVVVVANLKPRKLRGYESQGMVCAASLGENDNPALATFIENVPNGARLK